MNLYKSNRDLFEGAGSTQENYLGKVAAKISDKAQAVADTTYAKRQTLGRSAKPEELQQMLSNTVDEQIYTDAQGNKFQQERDASGNIVNVPYTGETRNLYIDNTATGDMKLGLARSDVEDPFKYRYSKNPQYDGTPGVKGVTVNDGALMSIELPYSTATETEALVHRNNIMVNKRAAGLGKVDKKTKELYGQGYTEYYGKDAPLFNQNAEVVAGTPVKGTYIMDEPTPEQAYKYRASQASKYSDQVLGDITTKEKGILESIPNAAKGLMSGIVNTASSVSRAPEKLYDLLGGDYLEKGSDFQKQYPTYSKYVKGTIDAMSQGAKALDKYNSELIGYNPRKGELLQKQIGKAWEEKNYVTGILGALADNPAGAMEMAANMYGFSKAMGAKGLTGIPAIAGSYMDNADQAQAIYEKEYGKKPEGEALANILMLSAAGTAMDTVMSKAIFSKAGGNKLATAVTAAIDGIVSKVPSAVARAALGVAGKTSALMVGEGLQEGFTEATTVLGGTQDLDKAMQDKYKKQVYEAAGIGAVTGPGMKAIGMAENVGGLALEVGKDLNAGVDAFRTRNPSMSDAERREVELAGGVPTSDVGYTKQANEYTDTFKRAMQSNDMTTAKGSIDEYLQQTQAKLDAGELKEGSPEYIDTRSQLTEMYREYYSKAQKTVTPEFQAASRDYKRYKEDPTTPPDVLGSSRESLGRNIQDIIDSGMSLDETDNAEMETLAKDLGIDTAQYKVEQEAIAPFKALEGKSVNQVTYEALIGENGVQRVYEKLKAAVKAKDNNAAVGFMRQLENFKNTQVSKVEALQKGLAQYEAEIESNPKAKVEVPYSVDQSKKFKIGVDGKIDTPKHAINATNSIINEASKTIEMLDKVLQAVQVKASKEVVQEVKATEVIQATDKVDQELDAKLDKLAGTREVVALESDVSEIDKHITSIVAGSIDVNAIKEAIIFFIKQGNRDIAKLGLERLKRNMLNVSKQRTATGADNDMLKKNREATKTAYEEASRLYDIWSKEVETPTEVTETQVEETKPKEVVKDTSEVKEESTEAEGKSKWKGIEYSVVPRDKSKPLASTGRKGIKIQEGITAKDVLEYLESEHVVESDKMKSIVATKNEVNTTMKQEYGVDLEAVVKDMNDQEIRQFLLLHEHRHTMQIGKRDSFDTFLQEYKQDPAKFELDANVYALKELGYITKPIAKGKEKVKEVEDTRTEDEKQVDKMDEYIASYSEEIAKLKSEKIVVKKNIENHKAMIYRYKGKWSRALQEYKKVKEDTWLKELKVLISAIKSEVSKFVGLIAKHRTVVSENFKRLEEINTRMTEISKNVKFIKEVKAGLVAVDSNSVLKDAVDSSVLDMLESTGKKVKSVLALSPETRKTMMWSMRNISKKYPELMRSYGQVALRMNGSKLDSDMKNESPIRMLFDKQGNMPQLMAEAMAIEVVNYVANKISDLSYNDDAQIKKMLGVKDSAIVPNSVRQAMKGIGRFYKLEAQAIGKGILKNMGLKQKDSVDMDTQTRLEADIGALAIAVMEDMGMIAYSSELTTTDYLDYKAKIEHDNGIEYSDASEVLRGEGKTISTVKINPAVSKNSIDQNRKMMDQIEEDLGIEGYNKKPTLEPLEKQDVMRGMEKETQIPKKQQKVLKKLRNQPWTINTKRVQALKDMYAKDKQAVLEMFGREDPKMVWVDKRDAVESKNRDIEQSIESIIEYTEKVGTKEIFLDWFFSKNGRFFVDSTRVNPQTDKIHRFLMSPVGSVSIIDDKHRDTFKLGVVQAFDGSADTIELEDGTRVKDLGAIDKQSMEASIKDFDTLMEKHSQAVKDVKAGKTTTKAVMEAINGTDHPMHALAALEAMGQYKEAGSFETDLTIETDAVTSGFMLGMLLNPVMTYAKVKEWLAKGGVWLGGTKAKSYGEYVSTEGNLDAYNTGAKGTSDILEKMIGDKPVLGRVVKALEGLVKVDRKFMKQPFMVFIYGSGIDNIKKNISVKYADDLMSMLASEKDNEKALEIINDLLRLQDMPSISMTAEQARETSLTGMSQDSATLSKVYKIAIKAVESTYGDAVGNYLGTEFGQIVSMRKAMNKAYVAMFKEFKKEYGKRVKFDSTKEEVDAVLEEMMTEGKIPGIFTVHSDRENKGEKLVVADKAVISPKGLRGQKVKIQSKFTDRMSPPNRTLNPMIREMVEAPASGAVLGIHMVDGSIMSDTLENTIGLGVHDAVVSAISDAVETAKDYSNTTWYITQSYDLLGEIIAQTPKSEWELIADLKEFRDTAVRNKELMSKKYVEIEHMSIPGSKVSIGEDRSKPMSEEKILQDTPNEVVNGIGRLKGKVRTEDMNAIMSVIKQFKEC